MAEAAAVYGRLVAAQIRSQLQYRASFALEVAATFLLSFLDFLAVLIVFHNTPRLGGWNVHQVAFLYGTSAVSFAFAELALGHSELLSSSLRTGSFDLMLVRPRGTLFQLAAGDFPLRRLGRAAQGVVVLVFAVAGAGIHWDAGRVAMVAVMLASGVVLFSAMWVGALCAMFWTTEGSEFTNSFTYGGQALTQYPVQIYSSWLRRFLAYLLPTAFVAFFPALYVLDLPDPLGLPYAVRFLSPLVAALAAVAAGLGWRAAVRHYRSAGG